MERAIRDAIVNEQGTPCYVFDFDAFTRRLSAAASLCAGEIGLCYAMKANPFLARAASEQLERLEVCSPGELEICKRQGVDMRKIIFSGVNKTPQDIAVALDLGVILFTAESLRHVAMLQAAAKARACVIDVFLRLTNGNQFGMDKTAFTDVIAARDTYDGLHIKGIHYFSGTQKKKDKETIDELLFLDSLCAELETQYDFTVEEIEYGPGLRVPYFETDDHSDTLAPLKNCLPALRSLAEKRRVVIEMGRFFAADCGTYCTQVNDVKENKGIRYAILDGGMHHVNYFGQTMAMKIPQMRAVPERSGEKVPYTLCGSLCTTADVLVRNACFTNLQIGDTIEFANVGAYAVTEGISLFLSRDLPKVIGYSAKEGAVLLRDTIGTYHMNG